MKSAIGEGMTREDHADVSNQLVCTISEKKREMKKYPPPCLWKGKLTEKNLTYKLQLL